MKSIKENIANNIAELRKRNNLTQIQLGEIINYSDKAISKWERGESTPDIDALESLSAYFKIDFDYFFKEHSDEELNSVTLKKDNTKKIFTLAMAITTIVFISIVLFIFFQLKNSPFTKDSWILFIWCVPLICLSLILFFKSLKIKLGSLISSSILVWSLLGCFYITFLINDINFWLIFLIGIPIQAYLCFNFFFKR